MRRLLCPLTTFKESKMIHKGDTVKILPVFQDVGDDDFVWKAVEDEDGGRVRVEAAIPGMYFAKTEIFQTYMLGVK